MIRLLATLLMLYGLGGCTAMLLGDGGSAGPPIGTQTRGGEATAADRRITETILGRYSVSEALGSRGLRVETRRGVVTLRGSVGSYAERDEAFRLAVDVQGVVRVENRIGIGR